MTHDLIIIGAGPAGMAAALTGSSLGLKTVLLDEQMHVGGQIYRNVAQADPAVTKLLGSDYTRGKALAHKLAQSDVELRHGAMVWDVDSALNVTGTQKGQSFQLQAPQLIAATGAIERPSPLPGWTLPGVMSAGAAQIALKSAGMIPEGPVVLAGAGPLLLLLACQLVDAGANVVGLVETASSGNHWAALRHIGGALAAPRYLMKGLRMTLRLKLSSIPWYAGASDVKVEGVHSAKALTFSVKGEPHRIPATTVLLHHGVVPNTQLSRLMRVQHHWDPLQLAWHPVLNAWGETSKPGLRMAGDGASIIGALAAESSGTLAALGAAYSLGRFGEAELKKQARKPQDELRRHLRIRPFLDALYSPPPWINSPHDDTMVCRCEEVSAGQIRKMAALGCQGPNQTKFFSRCGMGPCQGRMCGLTVSQILAEELKKPVAEIGSYRIRSPLKPVPVSALAQLHPRQVKK